MADLQSLRILTQISADKCKNFGIALGVALEVTPHEKVNKFYIVQPYQIEKSINLKLSNYVNEQNIRLVTDQPTNRPQACKP